MKHFDVLLIRSIEVNKNAASETENNAKQIITN